MNKLKEFNADKAWDTLSKRIIESDKDVEIRNHFRISRSFKYAASIILLVGLSFFTYYYLNNDKIVEFASQENIMEHKLPDGSVITLNKFSSISYSKTFKGDTRSIEFEGEAYFDVAKDPNKPFVINANGAEVKVLGTAFNLIAEHGFAELTVTEGKVQFSDLSDNESVVLTVGERGKIVDGRITSLKNKDFNFLSWKTKKLYFKQGEILKNVASDLERFYNVTVEFEDDSIELMPVSEHSFDNDDITYILDLFSTLHNLKYTIEDNKINISKVSE